MDVATVMKLKWMSRVFGVISIVLGIILPVTTYPDVPVMVTSGYLVVSGLSLLTASLEVDVNEQK